MFEDGLADEIGEMYSLKRLFVFRSIVLASELLVVLLSVYGLGVAMPLQSMLAVLGLYAAFNLLVWWRLGHGNPASAREFFLHLVVDVLALAALFYFAGGSANPFVSLFLLPLVIVATTLPRRYVWAMAVVTLACYTLLMVIHLPLGEADVLSHAAHGGHPVFSQFGLHMLGMWFSFLLGVGVVLTLVVSLSEALRRRGRRLAEIREKHLRDEHVIALGTVAAGAAHELGTPLGTMAVMIGELEREYAGQSQLLEKIAILRSQVNRCKETLSHISASTGQFRAESGHGSILDLYLKQLFSQWEALNPETRLSVAWSGTLPAPHIVVDETLGQAIVNVLNNAAEASPQRIEARAAWTAERLTLSIRDFGTGLSEAEMRKIGKPFFTTKAEGHGLGFYLTQAVVHRLGGDVEISNHPSGEGAVVTIRLPLARLAA